MSILSDIQRILKIIGGSGGGAPRPLENFLKFSYTNAIPSTFVLSRWAYIPPPATCLAGTLQQEDQSGLVIFKIIILRFLCGLIIVPTKLKAKKLSQFQKAEYVNELRGNVLRIIHQTDQTSTQFHGLGREHLSTLHRQL